MPANEFTVKSTRKGNAREMTFYVERPIGITRDGEVVALGQLAKGDPVTVTYEANGKAPVAKNLHRNNTPAK